jgi:hypothetical protein
MRIKLVDFSASSEKPFSEAVLYHDEFGAGRNKVVFDYWGFDIDTMYDLETFLSLNAKDNQAAAISIAYDGSSAQLDLRFIDVPEGGK